jgi:acetyl esterase
VVAGESAGGNLAAAVSLRLRDEPLAGLAGQLLIYPVLDEPHASYPSRVDCETVMLRRAGMEQASMMYTAGRDLSRDQLAVPMQAESLSGLPPALVIVAGCDVLRDEGRRYTERLRNAGVTAECFCCAGQPHGFMNLGFPASAQAYARIQGWLKDRF